MKELIFSQDKYKMNWLRPDFEYARVTCPEELEARVSHNREGDVVKTSIVIANHGSRPYFTSLTSIGITFPLEDRYESSRVCMKSRCHTHIFCGENISYICALRMGGEPPHLGMVLTRGSLSGYSVERDITKMSNDRGCFILHPSPMELLPGEEAVISWVVFPHEGWADFMEKAGGFTRFVQVEASKYVIYPRETSTITIRPSFPAQSVMVDGQPADGSDGCYTVEYSGAEHKERAAAETVSHRDSREKTFRICVDGILTSCRILVQEELEELADKRCRFIAQNQQYHGRDAGLNGAYLIYDNEEGHIYYGKNNDDNAGRERVGMALLIAEYLQACKDKQQAWGLEKTGGQFPGLGQNGYGELEQSLHEYTEYVMRELVDTETGAVYNDYSRDDSYERLYNMPWFATFFVELYELYDQKEYLIYACRILKEFYRRGGETHYAIEMPVLSLNRGLVSAGMVQEQREMKALFARHADRIAEIGVDYPPFEVNYEQSIVAPAANILLQVHLLTGDQKYLDAGRQQLEILELFNGRQPDYHLYETAVRHWDGYWFGKRRLYGDTFPHYWSGLTGSCYALYARITGETEYAVRAQHSLRSVLSLIFPDGSGSCAHVFPVTVNGAGAGMYDPYANDQDWALYFSLRMKRDI